MAERHAGFGCSDGASGRAKLHVACVSEDSGRAAPLTLRVSEGPGEIWPLHLPQSAHPIARPTAELSSRQEDAVRAARLNLSGVVGSKHHALPSEARRGTAGWVWWRRSSRCAPRHRCPFGLGAMTRGEPALRPRLSLWRPRARGSASFVRAALCLCPEPACPRVRATSSREHRLGGRAPFDRRPIPLVLAWATQAAWCRLQPAGTMASEATS